MKTVTAIGSMLLGTVMMQTPARPPMKMGLWDTETQTKMNMPDAPAFMAGMLNRTVHIKSCVTPESYQKGWVTSQQQKDCVRSNEVWTEHGVSFDMTCNKGKATSHTEMTWNGDSSAHGTVRLDMNAGKSNVTSDSTVTTHWLGADCGDVSPDKPVFVK